jgi:hypothetical protein
MLARYCACCRNMPMTASFSFCLNCFLDFSFFARSSSSSFAAAIARRWVFVSYRQESLGLILVAIVGRTYHLLMFIIIIIILLILILLLIVVIIITITTTTIIIIIIIT